MPAYWHNLSLGLVGNRAVNILLLGKSGQLGWELQSSLAVHGDLIACGRDTCDLSDPVAVRSLIAQTQPDVIVNAAAYTAVDRAETEPALAMQINRDLPAILAEEARRRGALLVHYSSDYVYDGEKASPYVEGDPAHPISQYGLSKLAGDEAVATAGGRSIIFRTSWVFGEQGNNFVKTIVRLAHERRSLNVVADQIGSPTPASLIAAVTGAVLSRLDYGQAMATDDQRLYHVAAANPVSWHQFAQQIVQRVQGQPGVILSPAAVLPIPASEYPLAARRPQNSRLDCHRLRETFSLQMPCWSAYLARMLAPGKNAKTIG